MTSNMHDNDTFILSFAPPPSPPSRIARTLVQYYYYCTSIAG